MNPFSAQPVGIISAFGSVFDHKLGLVACGLAFLAIIFGIPEIREIFWAPSRSSEGVVSVQPMKRRRLLIVYAVGAVILGGSTLDWVNDSEHWPFSQYPMFSVLDEPVGREFVTLRLYGVTRLQPPQEFPLDSNEYLEPFDNSRLPAAFDLVRGAGRLRPALEDCLRRYDVLRARGVHHGPPLQALRLYKVTWVSNLQASNVSNPERKELLGEVLEPTADAR